MFNAIMLRMCLITYAVKSLINIKYNILIYFIIIGNIVPYEALLSEIY